MFLMSKCRGESDLGLCLTSGLAKKMPLRSEFRRIVRLNTFSISFRYAFAFFLQVLKSCTDLDLTLRYISILLRTYSRFVRENKIIATSARRLLRFAQQDLDYNWIPREFSVGCSQTPEGTGTGNNLFPEWSVVGTGNGNREQVGHVK